MSDQQPPTSPDGGKKRVPLRITQQKDLIQIEYGNSEPLLVTADAAYELGKALIDGAYTIQRDKFVKLIPNKDRKN